jgi:hypothetical protein
MRPCIKPVWINFKMYYQQLHLKYLCYLARYWLQVSRGWHDSVETCRRVIICEMIVHLLVILQNNLPSSSSLGVFVRFLYFVLRNTWRFAALLLPDGLLSRCSCSTGLVLPGFLVYDNHTTCSCVMLSHQLQRYANKCSRSTEGKNYLFAIRVLWAFPLLSSCVYI